MKTTSRFIAIFLFVVSISAQAQVGINPTGADPDNSAMLDVSAANKGLLIPRIALTGTTDVTTIVTPAASLLVYNTATVSDVTPGFYYYNGAAWKRLVSGTETDPVFTSVIDVSGSLTGDFLKYDGTKFVKFTPNFTESNYSFNARYGVKLLARNDAQANVNFVLSPKGNGAILAKQPDGTSAGGMNRGQYAVDLQISRMSSSMVSSGDGSVVGGGENNTANGTASVVPGGSTNSANGNYSTASGIGNNSSGLASTTFGQGNTALGFYSFAAGKDNSASGIGSTATGQGNTALGNNTFATGIGSIAFSDGEAAVGNYPMTYSVANNMTDRAFVVGNGTGTGSRSNAFVIQKNANTTIGGLLTINGNGMGTSVELPATRGTSGYVLTTNGSGGTNWTVPAVGTVTGVTGTAPIVSSGGNTPAISISAATASTAGSMSAADKAELDAATNANTAGTIVARDASGNFSAGTITAALTGNATTATTSTNIAGGAVGSVPYQTTANTTTLLAKGTAGQVLTMNPGATAPQWSTPTNGTVTSVTGAAPISVATGTTTPAISISAATTSTAGSMSAADKTKLDAITGTNTGNQTITLTGDVTGSGTGSFAATIAGGAVTNTKMAIMAANTIKINNTPSAAVPGDFSLTANTFLSRKSTGDITAYPITDFAFDMLNDANAAAVRTTIGAGTGNGTVTGVTGTAPIVSSGGATPAISISPASTSAAGSMSAADKVKLNGIDGSETRVTAGTNVVITGNGTTATPYVVNVTGIATALAIGQSYQGGIIFWLDATGQHGLIAATADNGPMLPWNHSGILRKTGTTGDGLYAGKMNTAMIVATQMAENQNDNFAAKACADYSVTVGGVAYGDWYLPSKYELNLLYLQKDAVGGFGTSFYLSSTEYDATEEWAHNFSNGDQLTGDKNFPGLIRAIRAF